MASLLEKAKAVTRHNRIKNDFSKEELELVTAWMDDEISITQIISALNIKGTGNVYGFLARGARAIWRKTNKK